MGWRLLICFLCFAPALGWADDSDKDSSLTTIHNIDLGQDDSPGGPNYALIMLDVKKVKVPGSHAHIIFRQFSKRVRLEFEASGIPYGKYRIALRSTGCPPTEKSWTVVHEAEQSSTHLATEKSLPQYALRKAAATGQTILQGMKVGLFQVKGKKSTLIDCKPIK